MSDFAGGGTAAADKTWMGLVSEIDGPVHKQDTSAMVGSIPKVVYDVIKENSVNFKHLVMSSEIRPKQRWLYPTTMHLLFKVRYLCIKFRQKPLGRQ